MNTPNDNSTNITSSSTTTTDLPSLTRVNFSFTFQFWFYLPFHVSSLVCYSVLLAYLLAQKTQRQALHNHPIIVLLLIAFCLVLLDYSWQLDTFRRGEVWPQIPVLCELWWILDYGFYEACSVVLAWASFERHILIFHSYLIDTRRKRILIHYLPLIGILIYLTIFYTYAIFFPPCENQYDYTTATCGANPCYLGTQLLGLWDSIVHGISANFLIAIFNIALLVRFVLHKRQRRQNWKRYRRMAFQLLSISTLFLSLNFPLATINLIQLSGQPQWGVQAQLYIFFFDSLIQYLLPFVCLPHATSLWSKTKRIFTQNHRRIAPVPIARIIRAQQQESKM